jgi:hypothetical protein
MIVHRELLRFSAKTLRSSRKLKYAVLVSLVPVAIGVILFFNDLAASQKQGFTFQPGYTNLVASAVLGLTAPLTALLLAGGMIADEVEDRTLTYLLSRPIPRRSLYASKAIPVLAAAAILGGLQALGLGIARLASSLAFGLDVQIPFRVDDLQPGQIPEVISAPLLVLRVLPFAVIACAATAAVFAALFGLVSLLTTRFHFVANLLLFFAWELPFGRLGGIPSYVTTTFWGLSIVGGGDPTIQTLVGNQVSPFFALPWLLLWAAIWVWAGMKWIPRRDFNITSATA